MTDLRNSGNRSGLRMTNVTTVTHVLRFLGDPTGYRTLPDFVLPPLCGGDPHWVWAEVGMTGLKVYVDASKAYLIGEQVDDPTS